MIVLYRNGSKFNIIGASITELSVSFKYDRKCSLKSSNKTIGIKQGPERIESEISDVILAF